MFESSESMSSRYWRKRRATSSAIAAKKRIVSAVSTTSSALPPPGSTVSASATSATTPSFQASSTTVRLLLDRAGAHEHQDERPERHPVHHEHDRRMVRQEAEQEGDRRVADHKGQERRHSERSQPGVLALRAVQDRRELQQPAQHNCRNRQQKREAGSAGPVETQEEPGADRRTRARHPRHERERLRKRDGDAVAPGDLLDRAILPTHPLRRQQDQAQNDQRDADQVQIARPGLDLVLEGQPEDPDRDRAEHDVPAEPRIELLASSGIAKRAYQ